MSEHEQEQGWERVRRLIQEEKRRAWEKQTVPDLDAVQGVRAVHTRWLWGWVLGGVAVALLGFWGLGLMRGGLPPYRQKGEPEELPLLVSLRASHTGCPVPERRSTAFGRSLHRLLCEARLREGEDPSTRSCTGAETGREGLSWGESPLNCERTVAHSLMQVMRMKKEDS